MKQAAHALRMTVHVRASGTHSPQSVATDIVALAHDAGLLAATVYPHAPVDEETDSAHRTISLTDDRALTITIVDTDERIRAFVPRIATLVGVGTAISLEPVDGPLQLSDRA